MSKELIEETAIEVVVAKNPGIVLLDKEQFNIFYERVKREVSEFTPDTSTEKGRKAIASLAFKVARTKTAIDDAGKQLNAELRERINIVDESRRDIREKFDALKDEARRPLTEWEAAEQKRKDGCQKDIAILSGYAVIGPTHTSAELKNFLRIVEAYNVEPERFQELHATAQVARQNTINVLLAAIVRLEQEETDRIELARLRAEQAAREAAEKEAARIAEKERLAKDAAERARLAEQKRIEAEAAKVAAAAKDAEEKARAEAERIANEAAEKVRREHAAELEELRKANERIETAARKEREDAERAARIEAAEKQRLALEAEKKAAEERKQAANKKHRTAVMMTAKVAFMESAGLDEETARRVVLAIVADKIPAVSVRF